MWKQLIKHAAATAAEGSGLWSLLEMAHRDSWTIVCYHRVLPEAKRMRYFCPDLVVTPEALRAHCKVYRDHFEVLTVRDAFARLHSGASTDKPLLSLSFDDGYRDNFKLAAPILAEFGLPASFYVIAGLVDEDFLPWYDHMALIVMAHPEAFKPKKTPKSSFDIPQFKNTLARLVIEDMKKQTRRHNTVNLMLADAATPVDPEDPALDLIMTSRQIRTLHEAGHEIGSHTMLHPILTILKPEELPDEVSRSRNMLEEIVGSSVSTFCYPNGDYDNEVLSAVKDAGYSAALSTRQGLNSKQTPPLALNRVFINQNWLQSPEGSNSPALLRAELALLHRFRA